MKIDDQKHAFVIKLRALYDIEKQVEKALPKMEEAASYPALKEGFAMHLKETENQIKRLEEIFDIVGAKPTTTKCEGIRGIITDGEWVIKEVEAETNIKDAMLASAARYVEHYEMAGYMSAIEEAEALAMTDVAALLAESLEEEKMTDEKLATAARDNFVAVVM